jgi:hypothetical protein
MTFKKMALRAGLYSSAAVAAFVAFETSANAAGLLSSTATTYASLAVAANSNIVTLPAYTYSVNSTSFANPNGGESLVFTFPTGVSAATTPGVVLTETCSTVFSSTYAPTYSSNTVTFSFPASATALCPTASTMTAATVTLPQLTVQGASGLGSVTGTSTGTFTVTSKLTSTNTTISDATAVSNTSVKAILGASFSATANATTTLAVSLSTANLGTKFTGGAGGTSLAAVLATAVSVSASGVGTDGATPYTLSSASVGLTITGTFPTGIASAYLAPTGTTTCSTTVPGGSFSSTSVTAGSITFGNVNATSWGAVCLIATGSGIIQQSTSNALSGTISSGTATNLSLGAPSLQGYTFTGGSQKSLPYLIGAQAGYASVIRVINTDTTPASLFLSVTSEAGVSNTYQATPLTSVAAGTSLTTTIEGLGAAGATTFLASGARGSGTLLVAGATSVSAQAYILQPGNLLLNVGAGPTVASTAGTTSVTITFTSGANGTASLPTATTSTSGNAISF